MPFTERDYVFLSTGSTVFTLVCGVIRLCPLFEKNSDLSH
jgi:hypothetical protein